ncbi:aminoglycoside phosphotransferase family protein [Leifsonia sp. H3M29-4]|uniref:aminoglycoside phosphotransferase family protein n=1 Tax=Salinibacterium metalliresistens TaxID=3031321 RepID=UPI0023DA880C|nr:aminoglycoside phosphotransferase family protein [Salinibacterium metalliresistens]MDF1479908.1 aminoglycoside phosphotransferase family protein [Salinibacterium metalliresistens]
MECVPFDPAAIDAYPTRYAWDAAAPDLVALMLERWHLTPAESFPGGRVAVVLAVTTEDGIDAVLKVGFPHVEGVCEAVALDAWGAPLAPAVLRQDRFTWSLLLERVRPGTPLSHATLPTDAAIEIACRLHAAFAARPAPREIPGLAEIMAPFVDQAHAAMRTAARDADRALVDAGLRDYAALLELDDGDAFLHGDFNPGNVLDDGMGWRVIDPKPMIGDPAFDLAPLVDQLGAPWGLAHPLAVLHERMVRAAGLVGADPQRAIRWAHARAAMDVTWYRADGDAAAAAHALARVRGWAALSAA